MAVVIGTEELEWRMHRYEERYGPLPPTTRSTLLERARNGDSEPRISRHPLGHDADPSQDQHTRANRAALKACLVAYWSGSLSETVNKREDTSTGLALADRFVSLLEIGTSLTHLALEDRLYLERRLRDGWTVEKICNARRMAVATYYRSEADALNVLIDQIWNDWI